MIRKWIMWSLLLVLFAACDYQELCYPLPDVAKLRVEVKWDKYEADKPEGMTFFVYDDQGEVFYQTSTNNVDFVDLSLPKGLYSFRVMNQSPSEFSFVRFLELPHFELGEAYSVPVEVRSPSDLDPDLNPEANPGKKVTFVDSPENLGIDNKINVEVTEAMVEETKNHILSQSTEVAPTVIAIMEPVNVVERVKIYVKVKGIKNARYADGFINNMVGGCFLKDGESSPGLVTHVLNDWEILPDPQDKTKGMLVYTFRTFGLPADHAGLPEENQLSLNILLVDNKTKIKAILDVGHAFQRPEPKPSKTSVKDEDIDWIVIVELPDELPEVEDNGGGGGNDDGNKGSTGFDVDVDEWGNEIEHDIVV